MTYINRHISEFVERMTKQFKVLLLTGSRQVGKTTMLNQIFKDYEYVVLDDFRELEMAQTDSALFFQNHELPLIIDEVQDAPELFKQIKLIVDKSEKKGTVILTGSQTYKLMNTSSDSLAGRICIIDMQSLSLRETFNVDFNKYFLPTKQYIDERKEKIVRYSNIWEKIFRGSMPELLNQEIDWDVFYRSYVKTYIERDVRELINVKNVMHFNKFMVSMAAHTGEIFNPSSIASDIGVTLKTVQEWSSILECSGIIKFLQPYEKNITKRVIKSPKMYFMDTGLVCYLVGWSNSKSAQNGAMSGSLFETFVVSEIIKSYYNAGKDTRNIFFYRDKDMKEIDVLIEENEILYPIEIKKSAHPTIEMAKNFKIFENNKNLNFGHGCILCLCEKKFELSDKVSALPIEFL